ncbi:hypothetical protein QTP86_020422, partial [Hemibagrus guttatus]
RCGSSTISTPLLRTDQSYLLMSRGRPFRKHTSVRRWLRTPLTHIISMQMKRFKKYINDKEQQQASTSLGDSSSWQGDDAELEAASQAVEGGSRGLGSSLGKNPMAYHRPTFPGSKRTERGLFTSSQTYKDITGLRKKRQVLKSDHMRFYPPEPPVYVTGALPTPDSFFLSRVFVWHHVGVWRCSLKCPRGDKCVGKGRNVHLYESGYHHRVL